MLSPLLESGMCIVIVVRNGTIDGDGGTSGLLEVIPSGLVCRVVLTREIVSAESVEDGEGELHDKTSAESLDILGKIS